MLFTGSAWLPSGPVPVSSPLRHELPGASSAAFSALMLRRMPPRL
jgi:hypothetical protein